MKIYIFAALAPFIAFIGALAAFMGALAAFIGALAPFMGAAPACEAAWALKAKARRVRALRNLVMVFLSVWEEEFFGKAWLENPDHPRARTAGMVTLKTL